MPYPRYTTPSFGRLPSLRREKRRGGAGVFSPKEPHIIASIFRRTYKRPIPPSTEILTRKGKRIARWKDKRNRTRTAPLDATGKQIVLEYREWYIAYEGAGGRRVMII